MSLGDSKPYPLSTYVLKQLSKGAHDAFFAEAERAREKSSALLGSIFEQRVVRAIYGKR